MLVGEDRPQTPDSETDPPATLAGRNLVVEATSVGAGTPAVMVGVVVSSVPREVPDWLISG